MTVAGGTLISLDTNSNSRTFNQFPDSGTQCGKSTAGCTSNFQLVYDNYPTAGYPLDLLVVLLGVLLLV